MHRAALSKNTKHTKQSEYYLFTAASSSFIGKQVEYKHQIGPRTEEGSVASKCYLHARHVTRFVTLSVTVFTRDSTTAEGPRDS